MSLCKNKKGPRDIMKDEFDGVDSATHPDTLNMAETRKDMNSPHITGKLFNALQEKKKEFLEQNKANLYRLGEILRYRKPDTDLPQA